MPGRYYHVMFKRGEWHLYFGDGPNPVLVDKDKSAVIKAARAKAREHGMKVIIHRPPDDGTDNASASASE
jgi:Uncharacterized protein conserved in bacteria (DUF2188)